MKTRTLLMAALLAAPAVMAQPYTLSREELRSCMSRDEVLAERRARFDREQQDVDRESDAVTRGGIQLAEDLRRLDSSNPAVVAAYNARSGEHNRRVHEHNLRVQDLNSRAALLNGDSALLDNECGRPYRPRDRDLILWERGTIR